MQLYGVIPEHMKYVKNIWINIPKIISNKKQDYQLIHILVHIKYNGWYKIMSN